MEAPGLMVGRRGACSVMTAVSCRISVVDSALKVTTPPTQQPSRNFDAKTYNPITLIMPQYERIPKSPIDPSSLS